MASWTTHSLVALVGCVSLAVGVGCVSPLGLVEVDQVTRGLHARTVLVTPGLSLYSPYDRDLSGAYLDLCATELERVVHVIGQRPDRTAIVVLLPAASTPIDDGPRPPPHVGNLRGTARPDGVLVVYVPDPHGAVDPIPDFDFQQTVRHELVHLVSYQLGTGWRSWLKEGLARDVDTMIVATDGSLQRHPLPEPMLDLGARHRQLTLDEVVGWEGSRDDRGDDGGLLYAASLGLVQFLREREGVTAYPDVAQRLAALDEDAIVALDDEWHEWVDGIDVLSRLRAMAESGDDALRSEAAASLTRAWELGLPAAQSSAADALAALWILEEPTSLSAESFLLYRARALSTELLEDLCTSADPRAVLAGQAARSRRGLPVDRAAAQRAWAALAPDDRRWRWSSSILSLRDG